MERDSAALQSSRGTAAGGLKPLRVGVIGLGVGAQHAAAYARDPRCRLAVLCDSSDEKRAEFHKLYPDSAMTDSSDEVLTSPTVDLVSIASFDNAHYVMALKALEQGKHVFVEKPLCQTQDELQTLYAAWKRHNGPLKLASNLVLRTAPMYRWLKDQIASGELGEIFAFDAEYLYGRIEKITQGWRSRVENYSAMQGGGVHMMDLLFWLTGQRPKTVTTWGNRIATQNTAFRYNDYMAATLEFPSSLIARITANFACVHQHQHILRVFGTKATFLYDDAGARLHTSRDPSIPVVPVTQAPKPATKGEHIAEFIEAVLKNKPLDAETQVHFDVMSALIASDQSLALKASKEIDYL